MDIQKELDEFTSQKHIREKLRPDMRFDKRYNHFFSVTNSNCDWINGAWYGWQEAKAQAGPEGFVLVEKTDLECAIDALKWASDEGDDLCAKQAAVLEDAIKAQEKGRE